MDPSSTHRLRLVAVACVALLGLTVMGHLLATGDQGQGGSLGTDVDDQAGLTMVFQPSLTRGDRIVMPYAATLRPLAAVFDDYTFTVVPIASLDQPPERQEVLFRHQGRISDPADLRWEHTVQNPGLALVWQVAYASGKAPQGSPSQSPLLGASPVEPDRYFDEYLDAAVGQANPTFRLERLQAQQIQAEPWYFTAEILLGLAALVLYAVSVDRRRAEAGPGLEGMGRLAMEAQEHLRRQLRLLVLIGPLLLLSGLFGLEAVDNGVFDPEPEASHFWLPYLLAGLWLLGVAVWLGNLWRVTGSLRRMRRLHPPDVLGDAGA